MAIFKNRKASLQFADLYEMLNPKQQAEFGKAIREEANRKATSEEELDDYYLTDSDVARVYDRVIKKV